MRAQKIAQRFGISSLQSYQPSAPSPPGAHSAGPVKQPYLYADAPPTARQIAIMEGSASGVSSGDFDVDGEGDEFMAPATRAPR